MTVVWDSRGWKQVKEKAGLSAYPSWLWSEVLLLFALLILFEYSWHMMLYLFQVYNITIQRVHSLRSAPLFPNAATIRSRVFFLTCMDDFSRKFYSFNEWIYFITGCHLFSKHFAGGGGDIYHVLDIVPVWEATKRSKSSFCSSGVWGAIKAFQDTALGCRGRHEPSLISQIRRLGPREFNWLMHSNIGE